ncbi:Multicopper oxidase [Paenibacillus sp. yr247]|uniref:multicopper oxidase domain-containing protein n=1 Tax=Paenibacillus sp. yr247 TaxID=1761880 RepID=UPI0008808FBD|nr:multicopper oxidase domain-containing protein [Paenibacillus sp. yr247]SDM80343.1 Multicopper oxidase [Paenibacillus sp. yr247]
MDCWQLHIVPTTGFARQNQGSIWSILEFTDGKMWTDQISERIELHTVEVWRIINLIDDDPHPIYLHLVDFQILDRQPFNVAHYGYKDTVQTHLMQIVAFYVIIQQKRLPSHKLNSSLIYLRL